MNSAFPILTFPDAEKERKGWWDVTLENNWLAVAGGLCWRPVGHPEPAPYRLEAKDQCL